MACARDGTGVDILRDRQRRTELLQTLPRSDQRNPVGERNMLEHCQIRLGGCASNLVGAGFQQSQPPEGNRITAESSLMHVFIIHYV